MTKQIILFIIFLTLLLSFTFAIHIAFLEFLSLPLFENKITTSYLINCTLTIAIFVTLFLLKEKFAESLGYIFFIGSFLKFIVFFLLINPSFKEDGDVSQLEFLSFFIPYAISLIFEVTFLVKTLNKEG